jgi:pyrroloquinoline quinone biosynthesis protein E
MTPVILEEVRQTRRLQQFAALPTPQPVPNLAAYLSEREACLALSPRRRLNYEKYSASTKREAVPNYLPVRLDIENVSRCNFRCTMCQVSDWHKGQRAADMSLEDYKKLIDEQYGAVEVKIQGFGEPTMGGESYYEMIRYARAQRIWVRTITNASRLHLKDSYKKLVDSDANEIQISIDGATPKVFEKIRRGSVFEQVLDNCELINNYARSKHMLRTKMWTVVQEANVDQLEALIVLADRIGFRHMVFSFELIDFGMKKWRETNDAVSVSDQIEVDRCWQLYNRAERYGIKLAFWFATQRYEVSSPEKLCPWPFERAYVSSDMRFVPCCIIGNPEVSDVGDAHKLTEEWNGKAITEFRKAHLEGRIPAVCKSCYK